MITLNTRVVHPEHERQIGTVIEATEGKPRVRVKWDDVVRNRTRWNDDTHTHEPTGETFVDKGKRTWMARDRLKLAPATK